MYLKSIEFIGYKSFAEKTRIELEPGLTGIVGPNGCGKSNVIDAVRWCLGEMSWKSLRAGSMMDVIFAGSARRSALSMAEVTLVFDNAQSRLPIQYSEVTVTRRIYRSGESEYYLNKTQCRLRDIRELFLDTGIGSDGYAIIDQGGVAFVLNASAEDRRALFEEAAGVAKFKAKREEALRKLERVEVDMGRLKDSVALISEQVRKLDAEARKARLYKKYKEELTALEVGHVMVQLDGLAKRLHELEEAARPYKERLDARTADHSAEDAHLSALNLEWAGQNNVVVTANQKVSGIREQLGRLEGTVQVAENTLKECSERRTACEIELASSRHRLVEVEPQVEAARTAMAAAEAQLTQAREEAGGFEGRFTETSRRVQEAEAELEAVGKGKNDLMEKALEERRRMGRLESEVSTRIGQLGQSLRGLGREEVQAQGLRESLETRRGEWEARKSASETARREVSELEAAFADFKGRHLSAVEEFDGLKNERLQVRYRIEALEAEGAKDPYWAGAQTVLGAGIEGVVGTVRDLIQVDDAHRVFLEDALGERLHAVVCEDSTAAQTGIDFLNDAGRGRARFLVLSSLASSPPARTYPPNARPLLERLSFDPRFETAMRRLLAETYVLGRSIYGDHWICGGAGAAGAGTEGVNEIGALRTRSQELQSRVDEGTGSLSRLTEEGAAIESRRSEAQGRLHEAAGLEKALETSVSEAEQSLEIQLRNVTTAQDESLEMLRHLAERKEQLSDARRSKRDAEAGEKEAAAKEHALQLAISGHKNEMSRANETRDNLQGKVRNAEALVNVASQGLASVASETERLQRGVSTREGVLASLEGKREEAEKSRTSALDERGRLTEELKTSEAESKAAFERQAELHKSVREKEDVVRQLKAEVDSVKEKLNDFEVESGGAKGREEMLKTRLWEEWELVMSEAREKFPVTAPIEPERIDGLRKRLAGMGDINLAAPEDYEALSGKQAHLTAQLEDLNKAKEDLRAAIQKINNTTRENFRQTFMDVREHFRRIYGVLFEGGEADLVLKDPENLLESGIDIVAQPPGKKLQHLALLSGGEKSLTAIALLFAFFMVRPSPFCLLDEADAALDDANIERFSSLLREFQSRTQFLVISHNKRTMEAADVIYGVTMEEGGVSQVVSIDFQKKDKPAAEAAVGGQVEAAESSA